MARLDRQNVTVHSIIQGENYGKWHVLSPCVFPHVSANLVKWLQSGGRGNGVR